MTTEDRALPELAELYRGDILALDAAVTGRAAITLVIGPVAIGRSRLRVIDDAVHRRVRAVHGRLGLTARRVFQ